MSVARKPPSSDLDDVQDRLDLFAQLRRALVPVTRSRVGCGRIDEVPALRVRRHDHQPAVLLAGKFPAVRHDPFAFAEVQRLEVHRLLLSFDRNAARTAGQALLPLSLAPHQSTTTAGSSPTTHASCPLGSAVTSPGPAMNSLPSSPFPDCADCLPTSRDLVNQ